MAGQSLEYWPPERLKPYRRNPRKNDQAVEAVAASIRAHGFRQPIVVDADDVIVVGETRWKAAKLLELATVPVIVAADLTQEQARAYRIADNKTGEIADWDQEKLTLELEDLQSAGVDLELLGFGVDELAELLEASAVAGLTDPDAIPEPPDDPVTQPGDLWVLGSHRLLCGNSASAADVDRLLEGAAVHLVNTDPPYNVKVEPRSLTAVAASDTRTHHQQFDIGRHPEKAKGTHRKMRAKDRPLLNDFVSPREFEDLLNAWFGQVARVLVPGGAFYIWGGYSNLANYPPALAANELYFSQAIIWIKEHPVLTRKDMLGDHEWCFYGYSPDEPRPGAARCPGWRWGSAEALFGEEFGSDHRPIFYGWRLGAGHRWFGPHNVRDVWSVKKVNPTSMVHLTEKPVELAVRALQFSSRAGEHVLDLFGGSGSTLIACEQHHRRAYLMELDPAYCDVIVQRWEQFTGGPAKREGATPRRRSSSARSKKKTSTAKRVAPKRRKKAASKRKAPAGKKSTAKKKSKRKTAR